MTEPIAQVPAERALENLTRMLDRSLGLVVALIMFFMMVLTFIDVVGRQLFDSPVPGGGELTEIALGFVVYIGLPLVCLRREHITIGLMAGIFKGRVRQMQHVLLNLIFAPLVTARALVTRGSLGQVPQPSLRSPSPPLLLLRLGISSFLGFSGDQGNRKRLTLAPSHFLSWYLG